MPNRLLRFLGELLFTLGILGLLYFFYTAVFSNFAADNKASDISKEFLSQVNLENEQPGIEAELSEESGAALLGVVYIPRIADDVWALPLNMGTSERALASGLGHYSATELPGEPGNFAMAGHRATNGEPLARFELLQSGDKVYVLTLDQWYEYSLISDKKVQETEVWVLDDKPVGVQTESDKLITLTTCDPRWNSYQRWVWWGELTATYPVDQIPQEIRAGY